MVVKHIPIINLIKIEGFLFLLSNLLKTYANMGLKIIIQNGLNALEATGLKLNPKKLCSIAFMANSTTPL